LECWVLYDHEIRYACRLQASKCRFCRHLLFWWRIRVENCNIGVAFESGLGRGSLDSVLVGEKVAISKWFRIRELRVNSQREAIPATILPAPHRSEGRVPARPVTRRQCFLAAFPALGPFLTLEVLC
jgi:hypothetical protein